MTPFIRHTGIVATVDRANIDTDAIIPKQFLKSIRRTGFQSGFFYDWRFRSDGSLNADFELNRPEYAGASILLTRHNFGCGSSREHAVWAVAQYGFRVIIAPSQGEGETRVPAFADIFRGNSTRNGLLCVELDADTVDRLFAAVRANPGISAAVDLEKQTVCLPADSEPIRFEIEPSVKNILLKGLDAITETMLVEADITAFEKDYNPQLSA